MNCCYNKITKGGKTAYDHGAPSRGWYSAILGFAGQVGKQKMSVRAFFVFVLCLTNSLFLINSRDEITCYLLLIEKEIIY